MRQAQRDDENLTRSFVHKNSSLCFVGILLYGFLYPFIYTHTHTQQARARARFTIGFSLISDIISVSRGSDDVARELHSNRSHFIDRGIL